MAFQDALALLAQLLQLPDAAATKASIIAIMAAADPPIDATAFILGEPTERWIDASATALDAWGAIPTMATRALFLRLATDPGDVADDGVPDQSADQTPRPGMLSAVGAGWFGTIREDELFAIVFVVVTNTTGGPVTFKPFDLTAERNFAGPDGGRPTYRNAPDPSVYTNFDGSVTLSNGASRTLTFVADLIGTGSSATGGSVDTLVTQSFGPLTVTNPTAGLGRDREDRASYIGRCILADASNAPGGPVKAYRRAATTAKAGGALLNYATGNPVGITDAYVLPDSDTCVATGYLYGPSGSVGTTDVSTANANILGVPIPATLGNFGLADPIGVLPDCVGIAPNVSDPITTVGFSSATRTSIDVSWSGKILASKVPGAVPGIYASDVSPPPWAAALFTAVEIAIDAYLVGLGPGGLDQVAGAGFVYTLDIGDVARETQPGLYNVVVSLPSTSSTSISLGHIAVGGTVIGGLIVVAG